MTSPKNKRSSKKKNGYAPQRRGFFRLRPIAYAARMGTERTAQNRDLRSPHSLCRDMTSPKKKRSSKKKKWRHPPALSGISRFSQSARLFFPRRTNKRNEQISDRPPVALADEQCDTTTVVQLFYHSCESSAPIWILRIFVLARKQLHY